MNIQQTCTSFDEKFHGCEYNEKLIIINRSIYFAKAGFENNPCFLCILIQNKIQVQMYASRVRGTTPHNIRYKTKTE